MIGLEVKDSYSFFDKQVLRAFADRYHSDPFFKVKFDNYKGTMTDVAAYIRKQAKKQAVNGVAVIADSDVFDWAIHLILEGGSEDVEPDIEDMPRARVVKETAPAKPAKKQSTDDAYEHLLFD